MCTITVPTKSHYVSKELQEYVKFTHLLSLICFVYSKNCCNLKLWREVKYKRFLDFITFLLNDPICSYNLKTA